MQATTTLPQNFSLHPSICRGGAVSPPKLLLEKGACTDMCQNLRAAQTLQHRISTGHTGFKKSTLKMMIPYSVHGGVGLDGRNHLSSVSKFPLHKVLLNPETVGHKGPPVLSLHMMGHSLRRERHQVKEPTVSFTWGNYVQKRGSRLATSKLRKPGQECLQLGSLVGLRQRTRKIICLPTLRGGSEL